jgi:hypothetical protein
MNICPQCGCENRQGVLICQDCGVNIYDTSFGSTQVMHRDDLPGATHALHETGQLIRTRQVVFQVMEGPSITTDIEGDMILGRTNIYSPHSPDIDLTKFRAFEQGVSCRHAQLSRNDDRLQIADLGSTNGTYLNTERLVPHQPYAVKHGDEIRLGQLFLRVRFEN